MNRRSFAKKITAGISSLAIVSIASKAVAGDFFGEDFGVEEIQAGPQIQISRNHGHKMIIAMSDLMNEDSLKIEIRGSSRHGHSVTFNRTAIDKILNGELVKVASSSGFGHRHQVSIQIAALVS